MPSVSGPHRQRRHQQQSERVFLTNSGDAASTTNPVTVIVADNGSPSWNASRSFSVIVPPLALPQLSAEPLANGQFALQVTGDFGPDYSILVSTNLANWSTVYATNSPVLPFAWVDTNSPNWPARFYRAQLNP